MAAIIVGPTNWQKGEYESQEVQLASLGDPVPGGYLICRSGGGTAWIVAPNTTEVSRTWQCRDDAVTTANANAACGDWFVPTCGQLQNPGYTCRTYWDSYSNVSYGYYSSSAASGSFVWTICFANGTARQSNSFYSLPIRAFRCVTY